MGDRRFGPLRGRKDRKSPVGRSSLRYPGGSGGSCCPRSGWSHRMTRRSYLAHSHRPAEPFRSGEGRAIGPTPVSCWRLSAQGERCLRGFLALRIPAPSHPIGSSPLLSASFLEGGLTALQRPREVGPPGPLVGEGEGGLQRPVLGLQRHCLLEFRDPLLELASEKVGGREVGARGDIAWRAPERPLKLGDRLLEPALLEASSPQGAPPSDVLRLDREHLVQQGNPLLEPPATDIEFAEAEGGLDGGGVLLEQAPVLRLGLLDLALPCIDVRQVELGRRIGGVESKRERQLLLRRRKLTLPGQRRP